ncbi:hypothetical protein KXW98_003265 [Aspergillus fumigatus]|uniref:Sequence orphan n=3 Tax=Aspergillus fumigatus TaxID=746128 RepID=A4DA76_ASPFU|nr:conserved hypothetical protein [Aspergillus fumigatus Af293]EDP47306.1 hypothetical protein AFUB_099070 [Aspergillus fumigatus A1163]KAF4255950.1 hypothetical protein CNMCM8714_003930 [Aspergillus fumigatus]KMK58077.1 hypothetical protein Y699_03497 [Aspergillus fumigatus Z5]EBA27191.1 conserved hypothetical protein [Aspergillus fumigatus Af293]KAF4264080.1 hypothetical protein CNMCM8812_003725 [Aspergillus fumigatus]
MSRNALTPDGPVTIPAPAAERALKPPTAPTASASATASSRWNTDKLGMRLGVDIASAMTAGALTCPVITVIDRAIIEKAAKGLPIRSTLTACFRSMLTRPAAFVTSVPFLLIYTLYTSTYLTANAIDTLASTLRDRPFETVFPGTAKFLTTTAVNMGICVYKDARFARIFGAGNNAAASTTTGSRTGGGAPGGATCHPSGTSALKVPKISYALFCLRDSITIFASFNVPALLAPRIPDGIVATAGGKSALAQFACPALMQFVSTPMHLLGLDLYNRQPVGGLGWRERVGRIRRDYVASCFARMGKIVPAYGVGGVVNVRMREGLMRRLSAS